MGKTFCSLFSSFAPAELCQLYIYPTVPNERRCGSYYRVTDKEALLPWLKTGAPMERAGEGQGLFENPADARVYRDRRNQSALRRLLRDVMWTVSGWYGTDLKAWLAEQKPTCIFAAPGGAKFLYNFALRIAADWQIPIVTYLCDEFYFVKKPVGILETLCLRLLRRKMESLMVRTAHLVTISPELEEVYRDRFLVPATVLMTGASIPMAAEANVPGRPTEISYFGNVRCNRYVSLADIGRELDAINREKGTNYRLKIYTAEQDFQILCVLKNYESIDLCGFLSGRDFTEALMGAQLLLHVEAFDPESMDMVKHSVSTKIADSLASGIPLLAYGPADIASMKHLLRNECAITATTPQALRGMLQTAFEDGTARVKAVQKALLTAAEYHRSEENSRKLRKVFEEII